MVTRPAAAAVVTEAASATALQLRGLGFTWVFAPDADVTIGPQDPTIGSRSPSDDPGLVAAAVTRGGAGVRRASGIVAVAKHYPGHGSVPADSHETLPGAARHDRGAAGPRPAAVRRGGRRPASPRVMMSHIATDAFDPGYPSSMSPKAYASLRTDAGFDGLAVTDAQDMGAITDGVRQRGRRGDGARGRRRRPADAARPARRAHRGRHRAR